MIKSDMRHLSNLGFVTLVADDGEVNVIVNINVVNPHPQTGRVLADVTYIKLKIADHLDLHKCKNAPN